MLISIFPDFYLLFFSSWMKNLTNSMLKITQEWVYKFLRGLHSQGQLNLISTAISGLYYMWAGGAALPFFVYFLSLAPHIPLRLNPVKHWEEKRHYILFGWMSLMKLLAALEISIPSRRGSWEEAIKHRTTRECSGGDRLGVFVLVFVFFLNNKFFFEVK